MTCEVNLATRNSPKNPLATRPPWTMVASVAVIDMAPNETCPRPTFWTDPAEPRARVELREIFREKYLHVSTFFYGSNVDPIETRSAIFSGLVTLKI